MRGVNHNTFKKSWFYNISEPGSELYVEKGLSVIEGRYASVLEKLKGHVILCDEEKQILSSFAVAMLFRTESFQARSQGVINKLVGWLKDFDGDTEEHRKYVRGHEDISKKLIIANSSQDFFAVNGLSIVANKTWMPFVTSDNPVLRRDSHVDEMPMLVGQGRHCRSGFTPNEIFPFFYMPVTPEMALVSCKLIDHSIEGNNYIECVDVDAILKLNILLVSQSNEYVVSDRVAPLGDIEKEVSRDLGNRTLAQGIYAKLYTNKNRYGFKVDCISNILDGVCLKLCDFNTYKQIVSDCDLSSLEIYKDGLGVRGMRQIEIGGFDDNLMEIKIVSKVRLGII
jgi:hypothetical protein